MDIPSFGRKRSAPCASLDPGLPFYGEGEARDGGGRGHSDLRWLDSGKHFAYSHPYHRTIQELLRPLRSTS